MKILVVIVALFLCGRAVACDVHYRADNAVFRIIEQGGGINLLPGDDALCAKLKRADAELIIDGWEGLSGDNEVAFVDVRVANRVSKGDLDTALAEIRVSENKHRLADARMDRNRARKAQARKEVH